MRLTASVILSLLLVAVPARAEWRRAESPNFVLYGNLSEQALRQRILLLEDFDRLLRTITSVQEAPSPNRLHVYIVTGPRQLRAIRNLPSDVAGFYTATAEGIAAVVDGSSGMGNQVLFHEYAHHFMLQHRPNAYPAWYVEGFAEYFMTVRFAAQYIDVGDASRARAAWLLNARWLPMARVISGDRRLSREETALFYAQSWLLIHYFYSNPERQAALRRYLAAARRDSPAAALLAATGFTPDRLDTELANYIRRGTIRIRRMTRASDAVRPAVMVNALSPGADAAIADAAALRIGVGDEAAPALLGRLRAAAARFPNDPFVSRTLAYAEAIHGDGAAADRLLDPLLAANPNDAELMYLRGRRYLSAAQQEGAPPDAMRSARQWFSRAHRADGNHFQTLYRYIDSLKDEPGYISENSANVLLLAHQLAPQVHEITMTAAWMLLRRGNRAEAASLLEPLAADPHNRGLAQAASEMLAEARGEAPVTSSSQPPATPEEPQPYSVRGRRKNLLFATAQSR